MATQTIPITLQAGIPPPGFEAANLSQLLQAIATYISGSIRADVSFYLEVINDPATYVTTLIFNTNQQAWKAWSIAAGKYVTITENTLGDIKESISGNDQVASGWVVLNGRAVTAIPGLSPTQITNVTTLVGSTLPTYDPLNGNGLPDAIVPANNVIADISISGDYSESEIKQLRDRTEELRDSTAAVLTALNNNTVPALYSLMFIGYP